MRPVICDLERVQCVRAFAGRSNSRSICGVCKRYSEIKRAKVLVLRCFENVGDFYEIYQHWKIINSSIVNCQIK